MLQTHQNKYILNKYIRISFLTLCFVLFIAQIVSAQLQTQSETMNQLIIQNQEIEQWWDKVWIQTFNPGQTGGSNVTDYVFNNIVRWFLLIGIIFWIWKLIQSTVRTMNNGQASMMNFLELFYPVLLTALLLANNAQFARNIGWTIRAFSQSSIVALQNARIIDISIGEATRDVFVTQMTAAHVAENVLACQQMDHPTVYLPSPTRPTDPKEIAKLSPQQNAAYEYINCVQKIIPFIQDAKLQGEQQACTNIAGVRQACAFFTRFMDKTINSFIKANKGFSQGNAIVFDPTAHQRVMTDYLAGLTMNAANRPTLMFIQYWAISFMQMALWLDALIAPLAITVAMIPAKLNMTAAWLISMLTIAMAQIANALISGAAALQLAQSTTYFISDSRFEMALGIMAPAVAFAVIAGGGFFATKTFMSQNLAIAGSIAGVASGAATSLIMGFSRALDRKR
jgi:hypothetical protein